MPKEVYIYREDWGKGQMIIFKDSDRYISKRSRQRKWLTSAIGGTNCPTHLILPAVKCVSPQNVHRVFNAVFVIPYRIGAKTTVVRYVARATPHNTNAGRHCILYKA
jgi:hypothetical protein